MLLQNRIVLGEIAGVHGLDGELRVRIAGDSPMHLLSIESVWVGRTATDPEARRYTVLDCGTGRGGEVRLLLDGVAKRAQAGELVGQLITAPAAALEPLPEGEFYWYELIGCGVESEAGEQVGTVREIWETGAHDVLVVKDEDGVRRLIPTAAELMKEVDLAARRIIVVDMPGLLEPS